MNPFTRPWLLFAPDEGAGGSEAAAPTEDTQPNQPDTEAPPAEEAASPVTVDWESRYNNLRPEFDRSKQELSHYRQVVEGLTSDDPSVRAWAAGELGIEFADDTPELEPAEPDTLLEQRIARIEEAALRAEQAVTQRQQQEAQEAQALQVRQLVDGEFKKWGLDDEDGNDVIAYAINALPPTPEGLPDIWASYDRFQKREQERQKRWMQSKERAPHISPIGGEGTPAPQPATHEERVARALERWQAEQG